MQGEKYTTIFNLSSLYSLIWGLFVALPPSLFDTNPALYKPMTQLINSELAWGLIFVALGSAGLILRTKLWVHFGIAIVLVAISVLFMMGDFSRPAWALWGLIAVFNFSQWYATRRSPQWNG